MKKAISIVVLLALLIQPALAQIEDVSSDFDREELPETIELIDRGSSVYQVRGMNRLMEKQYGGVPSSVIAAVENWNASLDAMDLRVPTYMYFAEDSRTQPQQLEFPEDSQIYLYLKNNLHADGFDHLKYTTFAQFCAYYYSTDHHWNYRGSYQGYVDIVRMLRGDNVDLLVPTGIQVTKVLYNGSRSKHIKDPVSTQKFAYYMFDRFPSYKSVVNGKTMRYGNRQNYDKGIYSSLKYANHYAGYYGGSYGLIEFYSKEADAEGDLLIIGDSFANAVAPMLTEHFRSVIFVDLRHYRQAVKRKFSLNGVIRQFGIDQVLFLGSYPLVGYKEFRVMNP